MKVGEDEVIVRRREVADYVDNPEFQYCLAVYQYTKLWGLPNGNGWANEPSDLLDGITALELEAKLIEHEEYERKSGSSGTGKLNVRQAQT